VRRITASERRARLARRHRLAPGHRAADVVEAARSVVGLHATDPARIALSAWARVDGFAVDALVRALEVERTLVKHLAMRRTLWVVPREALPYVQAAASDRVAGAERRRLVRAVEAEGLHADGERWLRETGDAVVALLADGRAATSTELREAIPGLEGATSYGEGKPWGGQVPVGPRVLTTLSAAGRVVRATNDGAWTTSRPRWASMAAWLGEEPARVTEAEGTAWLVEAWLRAFGPGTEADLRWWLGSTARAVRAALAALGTVQVELEGQAEPGHLLPDDLEPAEPVAPWAALLPSLDPTPMGWAARDWYLGPHRPHVFDANGNAGPTAWWDGAVVGGWRQEASGAVALQLLEDAGAEGRAALEAEAACLEAWLGGTRVQPRFPSPLLRAPAGPASEEPDEGARSSVTGR